MFFNILKNVFNALRWRFGRIGIYYGLSYFIKEGIVIKNVILNSPDVRYEFFYKDFLNKLIHYKKPKERENIFKNIDEDKDFLLCGINDKREIISLLHARKEEFVFFNTYENLKNDEIYISNIYVDKRYRRKNISYKMRNMFYDLMKQQGFNNFYCHVDFFNEAGLNAVKKCGANFISLYFFICLNKFNKGWRFRIRGMRNWSDVSEEQGLMGKIGAIYGKMLVKPRHAGREFGLLEYGVLLALAVGGMIIVSEIMSSAG